MRQKFICASYKYFYKDFWNLLKSKYIKVCLTHSYKEMHVFMKNAGLCLCILQLSAADTKKETNTALWVHIIIKWMSFFLLFLLYKQTDKIY